MKGVAAYIEQDGDAIKLTFDDIESSETASPRTWEKAFLFTCNSYPSTDLENMGLSQERYAEIGENLVLRLLALNDRLR